MLGLGLGAGINATLLAAQGRYLFQAEYQVTELF